MIKRMTMLARKDGTDFAQFRAHWRDKHARFVEQMPMVGGYLQNPMIERLADDVGEGPPFSFDGLVELWFAGEDEKNTAFAAPAAKLLPVDEPNFIRGITIFSIDERELMAGAGAAKAMLTIRTDGRAEAGAVSSRIEALAAALPGVRRAVANRVLTMDKRPGLWSEPQPPNLILELRFEDAAAARAAFKSPAFTALGAEIVSAHGFATAWLVDELRII